MTGYLEPPKEKMGWAENIIQSTLNCWYYDKNGASLYMTQENNGHSHLYISKSKFEEKSLFEEFLNSQNEIVYQIEDIV